MVLRLAKAFNTVSADAAAIANTTLPETISIS